MNILNVHLNADKNPALLFCKLVSQPCECHLKQHKRWAEAPWSLCCCHTAAAAGSLAQIYLHLFGITFITLSLFFTRNKKKEKYKGLMDQAKGG